MKGFKLETGEENGAISFKREITLMLFVTAPVKDLSVFNLISRFPEDWKKVLQGRI